MPKFCTKCGSALINGKCPNCDSGQTAGQGQDTETTTSGGYKEEGRAFFQNLLMIIKNPVDGMLVASEDKNSKIGLIFMGIEAVLAGLFVFIFFSRIQDVLLMTSQMDTSELTGNFAGFIFLMAGCLLNMGENLKSFSSLFIDESGLSSPFMGGYLVREAIVVFLTALIISGLVYVLMRYMVHADINWLQSCQLVGLRSLGASMGWLVAIVCIPFGFYAVALIAILLGMILSMIYLGVIMTVYPSEKRNLIPYVIFLLILIMMIIMYVVIKGNLGILIEEDFFGL